MIVWVSGPTGSGKSTFCKALRELGFRIVGEALPPDFLGDFARAPRKDCARVQDFIMRSRERTFRELASSADRVAFDRSIDEDLNVFISLHRELGNLTEEQYFALVDVGRSLSGDLPAPELIVYFEPSFATLVTRVTLESHPAFIVNSLHLQVDLYRAWIDRRSEEVLRVDNSNTSEMSVAKLLLPSEKC